MGAHLESCLDCRESAARIVRLDDAWRALPVPAGRAPRRSPSSLAGCHGRRRRNVRGSGVRCPDGLAASLLLAVGADRLAGGAGARGKAAHVLDTLVDWNLALAGAAGDEKRKELVHDLPRMEDHVPHGSPVGGGSQLRRAAAGQGPLAGAEAEPLAAADHLDRLAEVAQDARDRAETGPDRARPSAWPSAFMSLDERGVKPMLERGLKRDGNGPQAHRWENLAKRHNGRRQAMQHALEQSPEATRQELRRSLGLPTKKRSAAK